MLTKKKNTGAAWESWTILHYYTRTIKIKQVFFKIIIVIYLFLIFIFKKGARNFINIISQDVR